MKHSLPHQDMNDLTMSEKVRPLLDKVIRHVRDNCDPVLEEFQSLDAKKSDRWSWHPRQLEIMEELKNKAKKDGLWNFFLPNSETGEGLSNLDYTYIAVELGKNPLASKSLNCSAPDTGNMEVLERVGTPEQKEKWLKPLLNGEIRSCFGMTEPDVASSDARNIHTTAKLEGDEWVINGEKYYISGAGDPQCKIMICMVLTDPEAEPFRQQSQILVPMDTPGVNVLGPMCVFGHDDAPHGHMHIKIENVRVPKENILWGVGKGFEISQVRLGPGRIHHCMRSIGSAEKALDLMISRGINRQAFGKRIIDLGKNMETISRARIEIEAMRLMVLGLDGQGDGAREVLPDHRSGDAGAWRDRRLAVVAALGDVHQAAHPAFGRRPRRGAPQRHRAGRGEGLPVLQRPPVGDEEHARRQDVRGSGRSLRAA